MLSFRHHLTSLAILLNCVHFGFSEVCSSIVEDISVHQCNPNQRFSSNEVKSPNADLVSPQFCEHFVDNVSFNVINTDHGIVSYSIVLPPASCGYTRLMFKMIASNATLCTHIDDISSGRALKSMAAIRSSHATEFGMKNVRVATQDSTTPCSNNLELTFEFVSSQCYQLVVQPFISSDSQIQLYSNWHSIITRYKPIHPGLFAPQFDWRHDQTENSVTVRLVVHTNLTTRPVASCVEIMYGVEATGQHACYESGSPMSQCLVWFGNTDYGDSSRHKCDKDSNVHRTSMSKCASEVGNELVCWIENVTAGNYCVVMKLLDERCQRSESACSWHKMFTVNNKSILSPSYSSLFPPSSSSSLSSSLLIALSILILLGVAALLVVKTCHRKRSSLSRYKHYVLPLSSTSSTALQEKQVLLLYARDCDVMMNVVKDFKLLLRRTGKCQVFDFWDVTQFNDVARNPLAWLGFHLTNEKMIVITIDTPVATLLLQNLKYNHSTAQPNNCIDRTKVTSPGGDLSHGDHVHNIHIQNSVSQDSTSLVSQKLISLSDEQCMPLLSDTAQVVLKSEETSRVNVKYKESKCFDNLFVTAVSSLAQQCNSHHRVYIVSFDANGQSLCSNFLRPVTLTRFILPQHVESLLYHIHSLSPHTKQFTMDRSEEYLKLKQSIDLMLTFRQSQPQYLLDLLVNMV